MSGCGSIVMSAEVGSLECWGDVVSIPSSSVLVDVLVPGFVVGIKEHFSHYFVLLLLSSLLWCENTVRKMLLIQQ